MSSLFTPSEKGGAADCTAESVCGVSPAFLFDNRPIGVFDSGYGGLTVARALQSTLPEESIIYVGDSARCPYGPRNQAEVATFVQQIGAWLAAHDVKLIVIACNTATAAGLVAAQQTFTVPVVGVVEPGARAAAYATYNRRVGVIATKGTVESNVYSEAIRRIDAGITVFSTATPRFVEIAEMGLKLAQGPLENFMAETTKVYIRPEFETIARQYLEPLRRCEIDTLVLGCTHYPLLKALIGGVVGRAVTLVSSADETARDVHEILRRRRGLAAAGHIPTYEFYTTAPNLEEFRKFGSFVLSTPMEKVEYLPLEVLVQPGEEKFE
jgi:glutamate racemase